MLKLLQLLFFNHRFGLINALIVYIYTVTFQQVDEDEYGGIWDIIKGNKTGYSIKTTGKITKFEFI